MCVATRDIEVLLCHIAAHLWENTTLDPLYAMHFNCYWQRPLQKDVTYHFQIPIPSTNSTILWLQQLGKTFPWVNFCFCPLRLLTNLKTCLWSYQFQCSQNSKLIYCDIIVCFREDLPKQNNPIALPRTELLTSAWNLCQSRSCPNPLLQLSCVFWMTNDDITALQRKWQWWLVVTQHGLVDC